MNIIPGRYAIKTRDDHGRETLSLVEVVELRTASDELLLRWRYAGDSDLKTLATFPSEHHTILERD